MSRNAVIDLSFFAGAIAAISAIEEQARTQRKGRVNLASAVKCGVLLAKLAKNGGLDQLGQPARTRLYNGGSRVSRNCKTDAALKQIMSEVGADLQRLGNISPPTRTRAKQFCEGVIAGAP